MSTMTELIDQGVTRMRLPSWRLAYAVPKTEGPWADIYDVQHGIGGGEPFQELIIVCDQSNSWVAVGEAAGSRT